MCKEFLSVLFWFTKRLTVSDQENKKKLEIITIDVKFGIIRLSLFLMSSGRPRVVSEAGRYLIGRRHLFSVGGPEPPVNVFGFQIGTVLATFKVAETSRGPDVRNIVWKKKK